jgi:hypothetical protein
MGLQLYDTSSAPEVYNVVWCKWPQREDKLAPGSWVRCVLVIDERRMVDERTDLEYSLLTVAYGTGKENVQAADLADNLVIEAHEFRALGLHKPTVFKFDLRNRKRLPWCAKYFVPQEYHASANIIAGTLNGEQQAKFHQCFSSRKLTFPLP